MKFCNLLNMMQSNYKELSRIIDKYSYLFCKSYDEHQKTKCYYHIKDCTFGKSAILHLGLTSEAELDECTIIQDFTHVYCISLI